ncbi:MAG TPA: hypothetical protein VF450_02950 [Noviherbaspirillum sp.]
MQKKFDLVFSGEKYKDRNGDEKTRFVNVGAVFERDDGSLCAKLESIPVGFTGWLNLFEPREREQQPQQQGQAARRDEPYTGKPRGGAEAMDEDDIPFAPYQRRVLW